MHNEVHTLMCNFMHALMGDNLKVVPNFTDTSNLKDIHDNKEDVHNLLWMT